MKKLWLSIFLIPVLLTGCNLYPQDGYVQKYVVQSFLVANAPLPPIMVSHTIPATTKYTLSGTAVNYANVEVQLVDSNKTVLATYPYEVVQNGVYQPTVNAIVRPLQHYRLQIRFPNSNQVITAYTLVPDTFSTAGSIPDSVVYQSSNLPQVKTTQSYYPGRQNIFIFTVIAGNPVESNMTPFYLDQVTSNKNVYVSDYSTNSSGIINQGNYKMGPNGLLTLQIPWLGFAFYGENKIVISAIDNNIYDFMRSQSVQTGGSTIPPGQIQNVITHIQGGIGVFGSMASDTIQTYVKQPPLK